jgi:hypothetical protein
LAENPHNRRRRKKKMEKEELQRTLDKAEIKAANDMDFTKEMDILVDHTMSGYTKEEAEQDKLQEYKHVKELIREDISPFYLKKQKQAVRAVRLSYIQFKRAYFECVETRTDENKHDLCDHAMPVFFDCLAFLSETLQNEFGKEFAELSCFDDIANLSWGKCETVSEMKEHVEKVFRHTDRFLNIVEKAAAERTGVICRNLTQYFLMICLQFNKPIAFICTELK